MWVLDNPHWAKHSHPFQSFQSAIHVAQADEGYTGDGAEVDPKIGETGAIRALDVTAGNVKWNFEIQTGSYRTGNLATAGGVLFGSSVDGHLIA